jgi:ATP-dependent exoDNAse (exonuclease V) alpha subunit
MQIEYEQLTSKQKILYDYVMSQVPDEPVHNEEDRLFLAIKIMLLSGVAGSGKTTLVGLIVRDLIKLGYRIFMTAPTHKAASELKKSYENVRVNPKECKIPFITKPSFIGTIHSALGIKSELNDDGEKVLVAGEYRKTFKVNSWRRQRESLCDLMIMDESSMASPNMTEMLEKAAHEDKFHVTYVGDRYQLTPPDGDGSISNVFTDIDAPCIMDEVTRTAADSPIIQMSIP